MSIREKRKGRSLDDPNKDIVERQEVVFPNLSARDIEKFGEFLEEFREERLVPELEKISYSFQELVDMLTNAIVNPGLEKIRTININEAAVAFGALSKREVNGKPCYSILLAPLQTDDNGYITRYEKPTKYDLFFHNYQAWSQMIQKKRYSDQEKMKHWAKMAGEVSDTMHEDVEVDD